MKKRTIAILLALSLCLILVAGCSGTSASSAAPAASSAAPAASSAEAQPQPEPPKSNYPERDIELVITASPGGGASLIGQMVSQIMMEEKILPKNLNLVYKPGGSSAVAMAYMAAKRGDPYYLMITTPQIITTPLMNDIGVSMDDLEMLCVFGSDAMVLMARPDGPFQTFDDVVKYAKEHPGELSIGFAGIGGGTHMYAQKLATTAGFEFNAVPFNGTSEVDGRYGQAGRPLCQRPERCARLYRSRTAARAGHRHARAYGTRSGRSHFH